MTEEHTWLEPIRTAAAAVAAAPPPLTEWEAGEDDGEVIDDEVEKLLKELEWPTRTRTFTSSVPVFMSNPPREVPREVTETLFPGSWLEALTERVSKYVQARDAGQAPTVPDRLRLRNLPVSADFDAFRDLVEGAWDNAWDELACSVAIMCPYDAMSMDGLRYNLAVYLWYGPAAFDVGEPVDDPAKALSFEERMKHAEEGGFPGLRSLPSPKWRAWFSDTWDDCVAIHDTLDQCGVEATGNLGADLHNARHVFDADVTRMTIEELVTRLEARHRFFAAAFRAARDNAIKDQSGAGSSRSGFSPKRTSNRPPDLDAIMEMVARLKGENVRWKEIKEQVETAHRYRFDSDDALRKQFERWQKIRKTSG